MRLKDITNKLRGLPEQIGPIIRYSARILSREKRRLLGIAFLKGAVLVAGISIVYITKNTIDKGILAGNMGYFLFFACAGLVVYLANVAFEYLSRKTLASLRSRFSLKVEKDVTGRMFGMDYLDIKKLSSSENSFFAGYDHNLIESLVFDDIPGLAAFLKIPLFFVLAAFMSLPLTLIVLVSIPLVCLHSVFASEIKRRNRLRQIAFAQKHGRLLADSLINIKLLKTFFAEGWAAGRIFSMAYMKMIKNLEAMVFSLRSGLMGTVLMRLNAFVFLVAGGFLIIRGRLSFGAFSAVTMYTGLIISGMYEAGASIQDIYEERSGIKRCAGMVSELENEGRLGEKVKTLLPGAVTGDLEIEGVSFSYGDKIDVFKGLDVVIPGGKWTLVKGPSGVGKTTLLSLILGLFHPCAGKISLGGFDLRDIPRDHIRKNFAVVHQEAYMLNDTILNNIILDREDLLPDVDEVVSLVGLDRVVDRFSLGTRTFAGETGGRLSGGERQRVALARALVRRPAILLLDEATSFLPEEDESDILGGVRKFLPGSTVVFATHRSSAMGIADNLFVMEPGGRCRQEELTGG